MLLTIFSQRLIDFWLIVLLAPMIVWCQQRDSLRTSLPAAVSTDTAKALSPLRSAGDTTQVSIAEKSLQDTLQNASAALHQTIPAAAEDTTSLSFKDTDIRDIFRALSYEHGVNIFVDNAVTKRVTISLNRVRVYDAIKFLCEQNNLLVSLEGGIFKITIPPIPQVIPPPKHVPYVAFHNGLLSVDFKNDDVEQSVLEIEKKSERNILLMSGTTGTLDGTLTNVDFDIGFTQIMNNNGFAVQKKNNIYLVSRLDYFVGGKEQAGQHAGSYWVSVKDSMVTLDVTNAPLERVLSDMIRQLNQDVVFYNAVAGNVTARVTNVALSDALDMLLRNTNSTYRASEGMYFIGDKTNKALITTKLIKLKYLRAEKILDMIPASLSSQATIKAVKEHNGVVVVAPNDVVAEVEDYLNQIDKPVAQVLIEALVVDYNLSNGSQFGVGAGFKNTPDTVQQDASLIPSIDMQVGGATINTTLHNLGKFNILGTDIGVANLGKLPSNFYLSLKALEQKGLANVRSRPLIATLNGYPATLSIGTTQYFLLNTTTPYTAQNNSVVLQQSQSFQTIEANVKLEITPYVGSNGLIFVDIKPDFKTPVGQLNPNVPPTINQRSLSSTVEMKEGETIVLGGLIQETETDNKTYTPILGSIPLLGSLFSSTSKSTEKSELIIYVTPHISYGEAFRNVSLTGEGEK